jgi:type VI secretion system secreted protein VgrG
MSDSAANLADYAPVEVDFSPKPEFQLLFDGLHAEQELGRPFLFHLDLSSGKLEARVPTLIGSACCIWLYDADNTEEPNRYFHGIVTRLVSAGLSGGAYRYKLEVRPWIWLLSQVTDCKIFQNKTAFQIVTQVFRDAGFSDFEDRRRGGAGEIQLEYCVQYRETSLAFVTRLMEQFGFYYYFDHGRNGHTLILVDDPNAHPLLAREVPFKFDQTEYRTIEDHIWIWSVDLALNTGKWTFQDYNFTMPSSDLMARTVNPEQNRYGKFEHYEYPGPYDTAQTGHRLSDVRMQALIHEREVFTGQSNFRKLHAGQRFKLSQHNDPKANRDYLITHSVTTIGGAEGTPNPNAETVDTYRVDIKAIPGDTAFRLQRKTPRPLIRGPQTARVVGKAGEEITTDEYGRIKVRFHWDRSSTRDEDRTCWIRVAQMWAGPSWGAMCIPRVDQEVVVEFLEGNPDRPLVTGVVYNANNKVPYPLPDNKTRSTIKTNSSTGGGGFNELRLEDKSGEEEIYLHAERDWRREIKHDEIAEIKNDRNIKITGGNDSLTISSGNHTISISAGKSEVTAAQSIMLSVGTNSVKIDTGGVTINGIKVGVQSTATMSLQAGASLTVSGATISLN